LAGIAYGAVACTALARGLRRSGASDLGPADWVTLIRATLVGGVTALTVDSFDRHAPVAVLIVLAIVALVLDAVDGQVARRTRTTSTLGARFDMEVDAFLILVLSVYAARTVGGWVLAIGAMRYAYVVATWLMPWMRGSLPPRYWRKVVAATQGIVLVFATADVLPRPLMAAALAASLGLLIESFGRDVGWLWRHRPIRPGHRPALHHRHGLDHHRGLDRKPERGGTLPLNVKSEVVAARDGAVRDRSDSDDQSPSVPRSGDPVLPGHRRGYARDPD
jgi:phosphatidylglycerophosphate synthase